MEFTEAAVGEIARVLGTEARRAPYGVDGVPAYQLTVRNRALDDEATVILWPGLRRVDVRLGDCSWVCKDVAEVLLYPGIEVMFRRERPRGYLFISVDGRVSMAV